MANKTVIDQFKSNPSEVMLPGTYTKNLAGLSSNTLTSALDRVDQMNIPSVTTDLWELVGAQTFTSQGISCNFAIDAGKNYKTLYMVYWFQANTAPTTSGILFTFNNDAGASAYARGTYFYSYAYAASAPGIITSGGTGAAGFISSNNPALANAVGYGSATFSIANNAYKHCHSIFTTERSTPVTEFGQLYTRYSNTSTAISSIQFFSNSGTYTGYIKLYGMSAGA